MANNPRRPLGKALDEKVRSAIRGTQLAKVLQCYALDEELPNGIRPKLDASRIKAIEILLKKIVPDLKSVDHSGHVEFGVTVSKEATKL